MNRFALILLTMVSLAPALMNAGQPDKKNPADSIMKVTKCIDFRVTGDGTAPAWGKTDWITLGKVKTGSPYITRFKILYSDSGLYCLYFCEDNKISATLQGDFLDIYTEDVVEAFFWADETVPVYFEYELSPLNFELPIMVPNYSGRFYGWRPWHYEGNRLTRHAASIQRDPSDENRVVSWMAEFFIPYTLLRPMVMSAPKAGTRWRANFYRIDYDNRTATWAWQPVPATFHDFHRFGTLEFISSKAERNP